MWIVTPSDVTEWRPSYSERNRVAVQWLHAAGFRRWFKRFQFAYRLGIVTLLAGVGITLVPPGPLRDAGATRLTAIAIAGLGFVGELAWIASNLILSGSQMGVFKPHADDPPEKAGFMRRSRLLRA